MIRRIDSDSYGTIAVVCGIVAAALAPLDIFCRNLWILVPVNTLALLFMFFVVWFHRVPERGKAGSQSVVSAVADGKIVEICVAYEKEFLHMNCIKVSTYMDFFDVHANFWPLTGTITYYKYHPGKYMLAFLPKSSDLNEHSSTCISSPGGDVFFKQIAGTFARRIVCNSKEGMTTVAGEQCGIIKFGSRIDMFLPLDAEVLVKVGDKTVAAESPIARLKA